MLVVKKLEQFISELNTVGIRIIIPVSNGEKEKIAKIIGERPEKLINSFIEFKKQTGIDQFSFVLAGRQQPQIWKKKDRESVVLNFNKLSEKSDIASGLDELAKEIESVKEKPREDLIEKISQASIKEEKEIKEVKQVPL